MFDPDQFEEEKTHDNRSAERLVEAFAFIFVVFSILGMGVYFYVG